jgi:hypothetical protein
MKGPGRSSNGRQLTILAFNGGNPLDVAGAESKGWPHETEENDEPEQERVGLERRHGCGFFTACSRLG